MIQIYKFPLEEAKDIIRREMKLPENAVIEIEGLPLCSPSWTYYQSTVTHPPIAPYTVTCAGTNDTQ
jgi:hypothetical protein